MSGPAALGIGRDPASAIPIAEPMVSWHHAVLEATPSGYRLRDLGSSNGTFVNGMRVRSAVLQPGDVIQIGTATQMFDGSRLVRVGADAGGIDLEARNVSVHHGRHRILADITTTLRRNELVAVVGGSGAGKSTLIRTLAGILPASGGEILYNGSNLDHAIDAFRPAIGYVPQSDIVHPLLPVRRALDYAARLRLPSDWTAEDRAGRIEQVLAQVGLEDRADLEISRLSGGQRKRVSVALELLGNPRVLFLDEPTSGLDPGLDKRLMGLFRSIADGGRTVVVVTHSILHLESCDRVLMLAPGGHLVYDGPPAELPSTLGVESYAEAFTAVETGGKAIADRRADGRGADSPTPVGHVPWPRRRTGFLRQFRIVTSRAFELAVRDRRNLMIVLAQAPIIALILAAVAGRSAFSDLTVPAETAQSVAYALGIVAVWFGLINAVREITKERAIVDRERLAGLRPDAYVAAKATPLLLLILLQCAVLVAITTLKVGVAPAEGLTGGLLGEYVALVLIGFAAVALALLVSTLVANEDRAMSTIPFLLIPQFLLAGVTFSLGPWTLPASYLTLSRWSTEAIGGSIGICDHAVLVGSCADIASLSYPANPTEIVLRWLVIGVTTLLLLGLTVVVLDRQRARL
jgi:ABC-type multidrug transport system ATPase subunit